jgi:transcriptional regulator with GAF, ATPase, and Fis domain
MNAKLQDFVERYGEGFDTFVRDRDESALTRAYQLGRTAVGQDLSVLDLAAAHQDILLSRLGSETNPSVHQDLIRAAGDFFLESLSAFEVVRRALQDARETALVDRRHAGLLRHLSSFLADASLAYDASESLQEMLQLVAEHARELTGAEGCAARLALDDGPAMDALASERHDPTLTGQLNELAALYHTLKPSAGSLRMASADLERQRGHNVLSDPGGAGWAPRGWLAAPLTALDGRHLGLIQAFDKQKGDFTELDEAVLTQLAQMASAAVERAHVYYQVQDASPETSTPSQQLDGPTFL